MIQKTSPIINKFKRFVKEIKNPTNKSQKINKKKSTQDISKVQPKKKS